MDMFLFFIYRDTIFIGEITSLLSKKGSYLSIIYREQCWTEKADRNIPLLFVSNIPVLIYNIKTDNKQYVSAPNISYNITFIVFV